jgi:hypothetical protein
LAESLGKRQDGCGEREKRHPGATLHDVSL